MNEFLELHSKEITLVTLTVIILTTLIVLVPQLLRAHLRKMEWQHIEHLKAIENGEPLPNVDDRSKLAGRLALLVPMVVLITAGTVTAFLAIYSSPEIFPVTLSVWVVAGVVSLAAITGGVALVGRLANLEDEAPEEPEENYSEHSFPP
jgi:hypothetical protein